MRDRAIDLLLAEKLTFERVYVRHRHTATAIVSGELEAVASTINSHQEP
jgi:hypothetical protein